MDATATEAAPADASPADRPLTATAALAALGIVYGDLGTSPLYTYQTIVGSVGGHPSAEDALGLLSLVVWSLIIIVSIKYCVFVMRADNHGEGGILALMALVTGRAGAIRRRPGGGWAVRRGADLRRWNYHAGDLSAQRAGGHQRRDRRLQALCPAGRAGRAAAVVRRTDEGHRPYRPGIRPGHAAVVRSDRGARPVRRRCAGQRSCSRSTHGMPSGSFSLTASHSFVVLGRRVPGDHRRRGAVCRHGPFRP